MNPPITGINRNLTHYADPGFSRYLRRAFLSSAGYDEADLEREERRLAVQAELDAAKDQAERNRMGQFATPTELAERIHGRQLRRVGEALSARQSYVAAHPPLRPQRSAIRGRVSVLCGSLVQQERATCPSQSAYDLWRFTAAAESGTTGLGRYAPTRPEMDTVPDEREPLGVARAGAADFFTIKRGLATGGNRYFILSTEEIAERGLPAEVFRPILPSPRYVPDNEIIADRAGNPVLERQLFLLDCRLTEAKVKERHPTLGAYLEEGKTQGIAERYICRHRSPWYAQERRPAAPFLCTYFGRNDKKNGRPFRFILNHSNATAPNVYLMLYPRGVLDRAIAESPQLKRQVWDFLNGISPKEMLNDGRVYGGGLHKLEPKELGRVPATALADLLPETEWQDEPKQLELFV